MSATSPVALCSLWAHLAWRDMVTVYARTAPGSSVSDDRRPDDPGQAWRARCVGRRIREGSEERAEVDSDGARGPRRPSAGLDTRPTISKVRPADADREPAGTLTRPWRSAAMTGLDRRLQRHASITNAAARLEIAYPARRIEQLQLRHPFTPISPHAFEPTVTYDIMLTDDGRRRLRRHHQPRRGSSTTPSTSLRALAEGRGLGRDSGMGHEFRVSQFRSASPPDVLRPNGRRSS